MGITSEGKLNKLYSQQTKYTLRKANVSNDKPISLLINSF